MRNVNLLKNALEDNWQRDITEEYVFDNLTEHEVIRIKNYVDLVKILKAIYKINAVKFGREA